MSPKRQLHVEVYAHGGWWKDDGGRTGQVASEQSSKGPLATVAALTNSFGLDGWHLTNLVSARHNTYRLSFERVGDERPMQDVSQNAAVGASITLG